MNENRQPLFRNMKYCMRCCMPETAEGETLEGGLCRVCQSSDEKKDINWGLREKQLAQILAEAKKNARNNYDCILPISGGKDSTFQAHVLVKVYNMKPLAVTFNHNWFSETGWYNLINLLETLNIDHIMFTPNRDLVNRLAKRSLYTIGDPCWHCHAGCGAFPLQVAIKFGVPLLVYGEPAAEGGRGTYSKPIRYDREYFTKISAKKTADEMACEFISQRDVHPFQLPSQEEYEKANIMGIHLGDFIYWDEERQTEFIRNTYGWQETEMENSYKRNKSVECIMPGLHYFTCYLKRGFARGTVEVSGDIRKGLLTREEGFKLINKIDPVRPEALDYFLSATGMGEEEFYRVMERQRRPQLKGVNMPVLPKSKANSERILPFPLQVIEKFKQRLKQRPLVGPEN